MRTAWRTVVVLLVAMVGLASCEQGDEKSSKKEKADGKDSKKGSGSDLLQFLKKNGEKRELAPCMGDTRFKNKQPICQHLGFRFCMRLMDGNKPYIFGDRESENSTERKEDVNKDGLDWWEWSTQPKGKDAWMKGILQTGGHHWCTCALCTSEAVDRFGCDNLDITCNATDVAFIRYRVEHDHHDVLKSGWECLKKKCGKDYQKDWPIVGHDCKHRGCARLYGAGYEHSLMPALEERGTSASLAIAIALAAFVILIGGVSLWRRRASITTTEARKGALLVVDEAEVLEDVDTAVE